MSPQVLPVVRNPPSSTGDLWDVHLISVLGRFPGGGNGNPCQYFCLDIRDAQRSAWRTTVHRATKSQTRLRGWAQTWKGRSNEKQVNKCKCVERDVFGEPWTTWYGRNIKRENSNAGWGWSLRCCEGLDYIRWRCCRGFSASVSKNWKNMTEISSVHKDMKCCLYHRGSDRESCSI